MFTCLLNLDILIVSIMFSLGAVRVKSANNLNMTTEPFLVSALMQSLQGLFDCLIAIDCNKIKRGELGRKYMCPS
jgi:hypothetical protein